MVRSLLVAALVAGGLGMVATPAAQADDYIDYGTAQSACQSAAKQANAMGYRGSYCYQTGPGHYTLFLNG